MKFTVAMPGAPGEAAVVDAREKTVGDLVREGEPLIRLRRGDGGLEPVPSPVTGILFRWTIAAGDVLEPGEPIAVLAGVPEPPAAPALPPPPRYVPDGPEARWTPDDARRARARHDRLSLRAAPHQHSVARVDLREVSRLRARAGDAFREREGFALDAFPFVAAAVAAALRRFPRLNARWIDDDDIRLQESVRLALPRADDDAVPVLRDADRISVLALAREIGRLREAGRAGTLRGDERRGATFALTDGTGSGLLWQTPVLLQPQTGHLLVGDQDGDAAHLCLAHDVRAVEASEAAAFLAAVRRSVESADFLFV